MPAPAVAPKPNGLNSVSAVSIAFGPSLPACVAADSLKHSVQCGVWLAPRPRVAVLSTCVAAAACDFGARTNPQGNIVRVLAPLRIGAIRIGIPNQFHRSHVLYVANVEIYVRSDTGDSVVPRVNKLLRNGAVWISRSGNMGSDSTSARIVAKRLRPRRNRILITVRDGSCSVSIWVASSVPIDVCASTNIERIVR